MAQKGLRLILIGYTFKKDDEMKKIAVLILTCIGLLMLTGCGKDGRDGSVFLQLDYAYLPLAYADNNADIPSSFSYNVYYECYAGTYSFHYTAWDGSTWSGTYTLSINYGQQGRLFSDGADGRDTYYTLFLYADGPSFSLQKSRLQNERALAKQRGAVLDDKTSSTINSLDTAVHTEVQHIGNTTMSLTFKRVIAIK